MFATLFILLFAFPNEGRIDSAHQIISSGKQDSSYYRVSNSDDSAITPYFHWEVRKVPNQSTAHQAQPTDGQKPDWNLWLTLFTAIMAIATIVSACLTRKQIQILSRDNNRTYRLNRDTAVRELRAYLTITGSREPPLTTGVVPFTITNSGKTPARNVIVAMNSQIRDFAPNEILASSGPGKDASRHVLPPGGVLESNAIAPPIATADLVLSIQRMQKAVYYWGEITYDDVFGESHKTSFQFHSFRAGMQTGDIATFEVYVSSVGNNFT